VNRYTAVKLGLAVVAIGVWGYGARVDDGRFRLAGMVVLAVAFALRFLPRTLRERLDGAVGTRAHEPTDTHR
jgi:hypothetical protein